MSKVEFINNKDKKLSHMLEDIKYYSSLKFHIDNSWGIFFTGLFLSASGFIFSTYRIILFLAKSTYKIGEMIVKWFTKTTKKNY